jgi:predicted transcriptional regulator
MREIATIVGLTERAVQRIIDELTTSGFIAVTKDGRRNRYQIRMDHPLDHPVEQQCNLGELLRFMIPKSDAA